MINLEDRKDMVEKDSSVLSILRWFLLVLIKFYWIILPQKRRRHCLFKETCSHYVYRQTSNGGFFKGAFALRQRIRKCRKGYQLYSGPQGFEMELADGSIIKENEISNRLLDPIYKGVQSISLKFKSHS